MKTKHGSYFRAIKWIAHNDEPTWSDATEIQHLTSVQVISETFGVGQYQVAIDVVRRRLKDGLI